jgi:anti-anti-sigma factor
VVSVTLRCRVTRAPGDAVCRVTLALGDGFTDWADVWSSMDRKHKRVKAEGSSLRDAARRGNRDAASQVPLELARPDSNRGYLASGQGAVAGRRQQIAEGELAVRWERRPDALILWLIGALDRATSTLLDHELDAPAIPPPRLVIDLTGLELIDSTGLDTLVSIHRRARRRGDRLSFRHGARVARWPLELTRTVQLRSRWAARRAGASHEDFYFALAVACADVDHPRPGDRPRAA